MQNAPRHRLLRFSLFRRRTACYSASTTKRVSSQCSVLGHVGQSAAVVSCGVATVYLFLRQGGSATLSMAYAGARLGKAPLMRTVCAIRVSLLSTLRRQSLLA